MKVAILVYFFPPKWLAGTEIATKNIAILLAKKGHDVHVITSLDEGMPKESIDYSFHTHRIKFPKTRALGQIIFFFRTILLLKKLNPDLVHAQDLIIGIPAFGAKKLLKKPYLVWGQGLDIYKPWLLKKQWSRLVLGNADAIVALTNHMKTEMQNICNRDIYVIPNGVDCSRFDSISRKRARSILGIKDNEKVILFVGRLSRGKGVEYLIRAMGLIYCNNKDAKLVLVGDGKERKELEQLTAALNIDDVTHFVGIVSNERIPEIMVASDIFVLPSLSEGFPIVIIEAMAARLPIIATKVQGLPEIIIEGENGFLVEVRDSKGIADKALMLLDNDELQRMISNNNREAVEKYGWASVIRMLEEVYADLLAHRGHH